METDVVPLGTGFVGLSTAIIVKDAGSEVIVLSIALPSTRLHTTPRGDPGAMPDARSSIRITVQFQDCSVPGSWVHFGVGCITAAAKTRKRFARAVMRGGMRRLPGPGRKSNPTLPAFLMVML